MPAKHDLGPVLVVGAPRSGSGLLAWGLAQHPGLEILPGGPWLSIVAAALGPAFRSASGAGSGDQGGSDPGGLDRFLAPFGRAAMEALETGVAPAAWEGTAESSFGWQWVDRNRENIFHMYGISRLLPGARFIHVLRAVGPVVHHLTASGTPDSAYYTRETAAEAWLRHVRAGIEAEAVLGATRVLRVRHRDLVANPEAELRRCLEFLDEPFHPQCLRPLRGIAPDRPGTGEAGGSGEECDVAPPPSRVWRDAEDLSRALFLEEGIHHSNGSDGAGVPSESGREGRSRVEDSLRQGFLAAEGHVRGGGDPSSPLTRMRGLLQSAVPEGATLLVVSRGDEELVRVPGRRGWHFPQTEGGVYAGHHPSDSTEAIAHLEELRSRGADFLVIPCTAFWWMDHYEGFRRHLDTCGRLVGFHEDICLLFALTPRVEGKDLPAPLDPNRAMAPTFPETGR
jgi:hypothetical protein